MSPQEEQNIVNNTSNQLVILSQVVEKINDLALKSTAILTAHEERISNLENSDDEDRIEKLNTRLTSLEKWKWSIVGGFAILTTIITVFSVVKILN